MTIDLRLGTAAHFDFALALYLSTMRPYAEELMVWDERKQMASFATQWRADDVRIIVVDGKNVGWLQAREAPSQIILQQFFISPDHQRVGIGTKVLHRVLADWKPTGKPVTLTVLKNNPARRLYERAGFRITGEAGIKFELRLAP
jgi:ribosomal protein S18 acetylase RimI-like enzyme